MNAKILFSFLMVLSLAVSPGRRVHAAGDPVPGQEKFKVCARCHGATANASPAEAVPKLGGQHAEYIVSALEQYASDERKHPGMKTIALALTAKDREDIAAYIAQFELKKFPIPSFGEPSTLERKLENCRSCHGEQGNNFTPEVPRLIGQDQRYLLQSLKNYQNGTRKNQSMAYVVRNLTDPELAEMSTYYASQNAGLTTLE